MGNEAEHLRRLMESRERERSQWVRDLQHEMAQTLTALRCHLQVIERCADETAVSRAQLAGELVDGLVRWLRDLSVQVRPPMLDDLGLGPTLIWYVNHLQEQTGAPVSLDLQGLQGRLPYLCETAGFRALAELLPELLRAAGTCGVQLHTAVQGGNLWLFISVPAAALGPDTAGARAVASVREWLGFLAGAVQERQETDVTTLIVMIPVQAP